uniref:Uncharacterized protein n=1 Tax=Setaria digitata TaxID=48799 RepID=A0A915Q3R6_9BILA
MLYLSKHYRTAILAITVSSLIASTIYIFYEVLNLKLSPTLLLTDDPIPVEIFRTYADLLYTKPWARSPAFLIGFLFSFLFPGKPLMNYDLLWFSRFVLLLFGVTVVFALYPYSIDSFSQFLEWRVFSPFAKNTFTVFLISEPVSLYLFSSLHRPLHATIWSLLNIAIGTIILSNFVAFLLDVLISMPIQNIIFELVKDEKCAALIGVDDVNEALIDDNEIENLK